MYSERKKGTEIIIAIPIGKEDYETQERWVHNYNETGARLESIHSKYEYGLPETAGLNSDMEEAVQDQHKQHILIVDDNNFNVYSLQCP